MGHGKHSHMSKGPEMGHSPNEMGHSPNEMSLKNNKDIKYAGDVADETAQKSAAKPFTHKHFGSKSAMLMKGSPNHKYDRVVLGGNKGDKSKTKPGKKDY